MKVDDDIASLRWLAREFDQISDDFLSDFRDKNSIQNPMMKKFAERLFRSDIPEEQRLQEKRKIKSHLYKQKWRWKPDSGPSKRREINHVTVDAIKVVYATDFIACNNALQALGMSESNIEYIISFWNQKSFPANLFDFLFTRANELGVKPARRKDRRTILNVFADVCRAKIDQLGVGRNQPEPSTPAKKFDLLDQLNTKQKGAINRYYAENYHSKTVDILAKALVFGFDQLKAKFIKVTEGCIIALQNGTTIDQCLMDELDVWSEALRACLICRNQIGIKSEVAGLQLGIKGGTATSTTWERVRDLLNSKLATPQKELDEELESLISECKQKTAPNVKASNGESAPVPTATELELDHEFYRRADAVCLNAYEAGYLNKVKKIDGLMGYWLRGEIRPNSLPIGSLPWEKLFKQMCEHLSYVYGQKNSEKGELGALQFLRRHIRRETTVTAEPAPQQAGTTTKKRRKKNAKKFGRPPLDEEQKQKRIDVLQDYRASKKTVEEFCKSRNMNEETLRKYISWDRKRQK